MKRMCQIQRLEAKEEMKTFLQDTSVGAEGKCHGRPTMLDDNLYDELLNHTRSIDPTVCDYRQLPHPAGAKILRATVHVQATWGCSQTIRVSVLQPNNCVVIKQDGLVRYGFVRDIFAYTQPGQGSRVVCQVEKITNLFCKVAEGPTRQFRFWLYCMKTVVGRVTGDMEMVPIEAIDNLVAYRWLPDGIFGLEHGIILTPVNRLGSLEINPETT
jgi:hypothetical protein